MFVDASATGANDGTSWQDAFTDLQSALGVAEGTDEVWVARGTYKPTQTVERFAWFEIDSRVYGGFDGTEATLGERAGLFDETILSGDLLGDDGPGFSGRAENSVHVVTARNFFYRAMVLDGFTIRGGNANSGFEIRGGGFLMPGFTSTVILRNCAFVENLADSGGAIYGVGTARLELVHCTFLDNRARNFGGGVVAGAETVILGCSFLGNRARGGGGLWGGNLAADSVFSGNVARFAGGGSLETREIRNCTFSCNSSGVGGGVYGGSPAHPIEVANCVVWGNRDATGSTISGQLGGTLLVDRSVVEGWDGQFPGSGSFAADPRFRSPLGADGIAGTPDDDLRIERGSPCVDSAPRREYAGDGFDALGEPRFVDSLACDGGGILDLGALERQAVDGTTTFCDGTPSSLGVPAEIGGPCVVRSADGAFTVAAGPLPDGGAVLLFGTAGRARPFGDGFLCLSGLVARTASTRPSGGSVAFAIDPGSLTVGRTLGMQVVFRDVRAGGQGFNLSSAMLAVVLP